MSKIKCISDVYYVNAKEIAAAENAKEIVSQYSESEQIPIRVLEFDDDREIGYIVLAGEGALYPWKARQHVKLGLVPGIIWHIEYLRELSIRGLDNSLCQEFVPFSSITTIQEGKYRPDKDAVSYNGISSFEIYTALAKIFLGFREFNKLSKNESYHSESEYCDK